MRHVNATWRGNWPIPKYISLPGVRIRVKIVPEDEAEVLNGCDGLWLYEHSKGKSSAVILIDGTLSVPAQRYTLCHELQHVATELLDVMLEKFPGQVHPKSYEAVTSAVELPTVPVPAQSA